MTVEGPKCVRLRITGEVQGVGFRYYAQRQANQLEVTGWIRNARDGSVEAMAQGAPDAVERFVAWCRTGPSSAHVSDVHTREEQAVELEHQFRIVD